MGDQSTTDLIRFDEQLVVIDVDSTSNIKTGVDGGNFTANRVKCSVDKQLGLLRGEACQEGFLYLNFIAIKVDNEISVVAEDTALVGWPLVVATKNAKDVR